MSELKQLNNKIILVTGAGGALGRAVSYLLASHSATLILLGRNIKKLEQTYDLIVNDDYPEPAIYPMDLLKALPEDYEALKLNIEKEFTQLDGIIHCAGMFGQITPIEHYPLDQWFKVNQVNLNAPFLITQYLIPLLKKCSSANIIFTLSNHSTEASAYWAAYNASQFGLKALFQTMVEEYDHYSSIQINAVNPISMESTLRKRAYPMENKDNLYCPDEIAQLYLSCFLSSTVNHGKLLSANNQHSLATEKIK